MMPYRDLKATPAPNWELYHPPFMLYWTAYMQGVEWGCYIMGGELCAENNVMAQASGKADPRGGYDSGARRRDSRQTGECQRSGRQPRCLIRPVP